MKPIPLTAIVSEACRLTGVSESELASIGRGKMVRLTRELIVFVARRVTTHSFPEIARFVSATGSHATAIDAHSRAAKAYAVSSEFRADETTFGWAVRHIESRVWAVPAHYAAATEARKVETENIRKRVAAGVEGAA